MLLIPRPESLTLQKGEFSLAENPRILVADESLRPLAEILAEEMTGFLGRSFSVRRDSRPEAGDIVLSLDGSLDDATLAVEVDAAIRITGQNYRSVARGAATCLQMVSDRGICHRAEIRGRPRFRYSGLMLDLARKPHEFRVLKEAVVLCRFYKISHLHLHFSDDQAYTFPSTAFPELGRQRRYSLAEMRELEKFASDRGVEIVPEIDLPGHAATLVGDLPFLGCDTAAKNVLCPGREETYQALETLIGEISGVFRSSTYFHIGGDEFKTEHWQDCPRCREYMKKAGLRDVDELFCHFIVRLDEIVRRCGRQTIVWEGFHPGQAALIPKHIPVMIFESLYATAPELLAAGFKIINTSWQPLYVVNQRAWTPEQIHAWNPYRWENWWDKSRAHPNGIEVPPTENVIGAQLCAWEQPGEIEIASLRRRAAAMMERLENPDHRGDYAEFARRLEAADARLGRILAAVVP